MRLLHAIQCHPHIFSLPPQSSPSSNQPIPTGHGSHAEVSEHDALRVKGGPRARVEQVRRLHVSVAEAEAIALVDLGTSVIRKGEAKQVNNGGVERRVWNTEQKARRHEGGGQW